MLTPDPDQVLYRSWDREFVGLDWVIGAGLDRDDRVRFPALRWLLAHGETGPPAALLRRVGVVGGA